MSNTTRNVTKEESDKKYLNFMRNLANMPSFISRDEVIAHNVSYAVPYALLELGYTKSTGIKGQYTWNPKFTPNMNIVRRVKAEISRRAKELNEKRLLKAALAKKGEAVIRKESNTNVVVESISELTEQDYGIKDHTTNHENGINENMSVVNAQLISLTKLLKLLDSPKSIYTINIDKTGNLNVFLGNNQKICITPDCTVDFLYNNTKSEFSSIFKNITKIISFKDLRALTKES